VKFTSQGLVELRVGRLQRKGQAWLSVKVTDTGPGIGPDGLAKLFHQFEQTSLERASNEGTGLGLKISREYARLMGGDITVESAVGQGSCFQLMVPVGEGGPVAAVKPVPHRRVLGLQPGQPPVEVLLADDNATNRNWLKQLLMVIGCQVLEAENGHEAIRLWEQRRPKLILMDLQMPLLDGFEATRRIKASPAGQNTVVLALTATVQEESQRAILAAGAADLLGKPMEESQLFDKMEALLGVKFIYESGAPPEADAEELVSEAGQKDGLARLPIRLRSALHDAIANGDLAGFETHLGEVEGLNLALARSLRPLAEAYDYDQLLRLLT
jgi:CheY-like chemotaxis protein